jgi:hypothetical protein
MNIICTFIKALDMRCEHNHLTSRGSRVCKGSTLIYGLTSSSNHHAICNPNSFTFICTPSKTRVWKHGFHFLSKFQLSLNSLHTTVLHSHVNLQCIMAPSQRENRVPDKEAQEDDERQYGHGPLSAEELQQKRVTIFKSDFPWLTVSGIPIALIIVQRP